MNAKPERGPARQSIILASGSPRRRELLARLGWTFSVLAPDVDEDVQGAPEAIVDALSERKARAAAAGIDGGVVLAADTLVALDGRALGKPRDEAEARRMLRALSGRAHEVLTGVCLMDAGSGRLQKRVERSRVAFRPLTDAEIDAYVATGEPMDKAGAYGVQGGARPFVERVDGSFENVMGLPIEVLEEMYAALAPSGPRA